jgi:hypothetical protein
MTTCQKRIVAVYGYLNVLHGGGGATTHFTPCVTQVCHGMSLLQASVYHMAAQVHIISSAAKDATTPCDAKLLTLFCVTMLVTQSVRTTGLCRVLVIPRALYHALAADFRSSTRAVLDNLLARAEQVGRVLGCATHVHTTPALPAGVHRFCLGLDNTTLLLTPAALPLHITIGTRHRRTGLLLPTYSKLSKA